MTDHHFPSALKNYFLFWRPSLSRRLSLSFTLFGLVIGYAVFIALAVSSTNTFIKIASDSVGQYLAYMSEKNISRKQEDLLGFIDRRMTDIANTAKVMKIVLPPMKFDLYFQEKGAWTRTYMDGQGTVQSGGITEAPMSQMLEQSKTRRIVTSSRFFYGADDKVNVLINISPEGSDYTQLLSFDLYRVGVLNILRENALKAVVFFLLLFLISNALGHTFSYFLARPIEQLSREAEIIASGQYERRFTGNHQDEIGKLAEALNIMASRIIDGTREREKILIGILIALTRAIDAKSPWTAGHSERVTQFAEAIGRGIHLNEDQMRALTISAILHDIGKIAVPEQILDKPGKLTDEEFAIVKKHSQAGADIISSIPSYETILPGILHHHERWDGGGYPLSLRGDAIPLFARIICIADVYDALTEDRPYRKAWGRDQVMQFFEEQKGKMFDPGLVDVFMTIPDIR